MDKILVIDDDSKLNLLLANYLKGFGYSVIPFTNPVAAIKSLESCLPELIILDVMMPEMDGFSVCREIRKHYSVPVIMLTARGDVTDRIVGLELGADDYLPKPFEPRELLARIQTILRRVNYRKEENTALDFGDLVIIPEKHMVTLKGIPIDITTMEFQLLHMLAKRPGRIVTRDYIMEELKGIDWLAFDRSVDVAVSRLRQKIGDDPKTPKYIKTVRGTGYMFIGNE